MYSLSGDRYSAVKTESALIFTGNCVFSGIMIALDGTNAVTLDIYDGVDDTGVRIIPQIVIPSSAGVRSYSLGFNPGIPMRTGIYIKIAVAGGGSASFVAYFRG